MTGLTVLVQLIALVVAVSGATKVLAPRSFAELTSTVGVPVGTVGARIAGLIEIALGVWVLATGARPACAALALAYVAFSAVVVVARRAGAPSCGCFGASAAPPSTVHVAVNLMSAAIAAAGAIAGDLDGIATVLSDQPLAGVPFLLLLGTGAWLLVSLDTVGAAVLDATREVTAMGPVFRENATPSPARSTTTSGAHARHGHTHDHTEH